MDGALQGPECNVPLKASYFTVQQCYADVSHPRLVVSSHVCDWIAMEHKFGFMRLFLHFCQRATSDKVPRHTLCHIMPEIEDVKKLLKTTQFVEIDLY